MKMTTHRLLLIMVLQHRNKEKKVKEGTMGGKDWEKTEREEKKDTFTLFET